jgi:energy-coupling factor transporter transmembrane protein EcfT
VFAAAVFTPATKAVYVFAFAAVLTALFARPAFRGLRQRPVWIFLGFILVSTSLWVGTTSAHVGPLPYSPSGMRMGAAMALRALAIVLAMRAFAVTTSPAEFAGLCERLGVKGLGFTVGTAFNLLPTLDNSARCTFDTLRLRGAWRRRRLRAARLGTVTVMASALRRANDVAIAAEVRGFVPERARPLPLRHSRLDLPLILLLAASVLALRFG